MSQNPSFISKSFFLPLYFRTLSQNPSFISKSFLPLYFQTLSQNQTFISFSLLSLYFCTLSQNPSFISISFFTIIFPYIVPKLEQSRASQLVLYNLKDSKTALHFHLCVITSITRWFLFFLSHLIFLSLPFYFESVFLFNLICKIDRTAAFPNFAICFSYFPNRSTFTDCLI